MGAVGVASVSKRQVHTVRGAGDFRERRQQIQIQIVDGTGAVWVDELFDLGSHGEIVVLGSPPIDVVKLSQLVDGGLLRNSFKEEPGHEGRGWVEVYGPICIDQQ